jgi:uncharacterized membrane protein
MRTLRLLLLIVLALVLIGVALANRAPVTVGLFPANLAQFLGGGWTVTMPLFLLIFLTLAIGMVLGLIWEWLRESRIRTAAARRAQALAAAQRETGALRAHFAAPKDDVLAILDGQRAGTRPAADVPPPAALPPLAPATATPSSAVTTARSPDILPARR